ncbi:MerR family transcriptional regulator [Spirosoma terrae]
MYGEKELIRLQQILFYKELDFSLADIVQLLDKPDFDPIAALTIHRNVLVAQQKRLSVLLDTIDKTILKLKGEGNMLTDEELYAGFPKDTAKAYRQEAIEKYGDQTVEESENKLKALGKVGFQQLKTDQEDIVSQLLAMKYLNPASTEVQQQITRHYANILAFWGNSIRNCSPVEAYKGLAQLYIDDPRYTSQQGQENPEFATFLYKAMIYFVDNQLTK